MTRVPRIQGRHSLMTRVPRIQARQDAARAASASGGPAED